MPPSFIDNDRSLIIRYPLNSTFILNKVRVNADDEGLYDLANALTSLQIERPERISTTMTRQLIW